MLLVILGAGASHDFAPGAQGAWQPPLANGLFDPGEFGAALKRFPQIAGLVPSLRGLPTGISLEERLDEIQAEAEGKSSRAPVELMAMRYYLRYVLWECSATSIERTSNVTNYARLFRIIEVWRETHDERVCVVTFNYDTLLENAAQSVLGASFRTLDSYIAGPNWEYFKVHGSCTWGQALTNSIDRNRIDAAGVIALGSTIQLGSHYIWDTPPAAGAFSGIEHQGSRIALAPAIALPLRSKTSFACPPEHLTRLRERMTRVDRILSIGWRAQDRHFLAEIRTRSEEPIRTCIVTDSQAGAEDVSEVFRRVGYKGEHIRIHGGFSRMFDHPGLKQLLVDA